MKISLCILLLVCFDVRLFFNFTTVWSKLQELLLYSGMWLGQISGNGVPARGGRKNAPLTRPAAGAGLEQAGPQPSGPTPRPTAHGPPPAQDSHSSRDEAGTSRQEAGLL